MKLTLAQLRTGWRGAQLRTKVGVWTTGLYLAVLLVTVLVRLDDFRDLELNALGDFLAGTFAPLAFLWLVIGYFQQGDELKQNTDALRQQAEELKASVQHQESLAISAAEERQAALWASEPRFSFKTSSLVLEGARLWFHTSLRNNGGNAYQLEISCDDPSVQIEGYELDKLDQGMSHTIRFEVWSLEHWKDLRGMNVDVTCFDRHGSEVNMTFQLGAEEQVDQNIAISIDEVFTQTSHRSG